MVRGLDVFREFFAGSADQYVLIGGTAATLAMESAGLDFRALQIPGTTGEIVGRIAKAYGLVEPT